VVIAIIGVLVSLLLPAVQSAREAARRLQCSNNLKQMSLACHTYNDAHGTLPPGVVTESQARGAVGNYRTGWTIEILPFIEQQNLYNRYLPDNGGAFDPDNQEVVQTFISAFTCPSDTTVADLRQPWQSGSLSDLQYAPGSYKGVAGIVASASSGVAWWDRATWDRLQETPDARGPLHAVDTKGRIKAESFARIVDGTTKTMLIGEYMTETSTDFRRPAWGLSHRNFNLSFFVVEGATRISDFEACSNALGGEGAIYTCKRAFGSFHAGGMINFARCDGGVTTIQPDIDGFVYEAMGTVAREEPPGGLQP
jgi:type II secretory pathway pseudopilin PulG